MKRRLKLRSRTIVIETQARCNFECGYFVCRTESGTKKIHLSEIYSIIIESSQVYISSYLLSELAKNKIYCMVCDEKHNPVGQYFPLYGNFETSLRIQNQIAWSVPAKKNLWKKVIQLKIYNQAKVLELLDCDSCKVLYDKSKNVKSGDSTFQEANAASLYFSSLFGIGFSRKQDSSINAALNYGYSIILSMVNREICAEGYITLLGIHHNNQYNYFNLACDFMEPFRPIVDLIVIKNYSEIFDKEFKKQLQCLPNLNIIYNDGKYQIKSVIGFFVRTCIDILNKDKGIDKIKGFDFSCLNQG